MAKIYAPNKQYTGISAGVPFVNGAGETDDPRLLEWFRGHGYAVEVKPEPDPVPDSVPVPTPEPEPEPEPEPDKKNSKKKE